MSFTASGSDLSPDAAANLEVQGPDDQKDSPLARAAVETAGRLAQEFDRHVNVSISGHSRTEDNPASPSSVYVSISETQPANEQTTAE